MEGADWVTTMVEKLREGTKLGRVGMTILGRRICRFGMVDWNERWLNDRVAPPSHSRNRDEKWKLCSVKLAVFGDAAMAMSDEAHHGAAHGHCAKWPGSVG